MPTFDFTLDFGAFPGSSHATATVTSDRTVGCSPRSAAVASLFVSDDHSTDECALETIKLSAVCTTAGTIKVTGTNSNALIAQSGPQKGKGTRLVGKFNGQCTWTA